VSVKSVVSKIKIFDSFSVHIYNDQFLQLYDRGLLYLVLCPKEHFWCLQLKSMSTSHLMIFFFF